MAFSHIARLYCLREISALFIKAWDVAEMFVTYRLVRVCSVLLDGDVDSLLELRPTELR